MTMTTATRTNALTMMGSRYYSFTFARFYAGFLGVLPYRICQGHT